MAKRGSPAWPPRSSPSIVRRGSPRSTCGAIVSAARAPECAGSDAIGTRADPLGAARESAAPTAAQLFYAKIELLFFIGHLYLPDASFAPHQ
ncbi:hypothetical protein C6Q14_04830 [Burkholderia ambifaria]|nr:hypothetical protein C6Q14_04830 [Burkholderia ambifaria]